jgi:spore coat polysaccharide biosynthesis protein SpsF (cytidylyltransferase family)
MITAIIQARLSSTRLPNKVLLPLGDKTVLEHVIDRVTQAKHISRVIVATSTEDEDGQIAALCDRIGVACFRGSLHDVLDRYYHAAKAYNAQHICRVTGDCPLIDPHAIDEVAEVYIKGGYDFVSNSHPVATYPDGYDCWIFSFAALKKSWREAKLFSEREHVTSYIWNHPELFKTYNVKNDTDLSKHRLTIDEPRDYKLLQQVIAHVSDLTTDNIIHFLDTHTDVSSINADIMRDEGYAKSLEQDKQHEKN